MVEMTNKNGRITFTSMSSLFHFHVSVQICHHQVIREEYTGRGGIYREITDLLVELGQIAPNWL
jgi:hypothetical protein